VRPIADLPAQLGAEITPRALGLPGIVGEAQPALASTEVSAVRIREPRPEPQRACIADRVRGDREAAVALHGGHHRALRGHADRRLAVGHGAQRGARARVVLAALDPERALADRGQAYGRIQYLGGPIFPAEAAQARERQHDRLELATLD